MAGFRPGALPLLPGKDSDGDGESASRLPYSASAPDVTSRASRISPPGARRGRHDGKAATNRVKNPSPLLQTIVDSRPHTVGELAWNSTWIPPPSGMSRVAATVTLASGGARGLGLSHSMGALPSLSARTTLAPAAPWTPLLPIGAGSSPPPGSPPPGASPEPSAQVLAAALDRVTREFGAAVRDGAGERAASEWVQRQLGLEGDAARDAAEWLRRQLTLAAAEVMRLATWRAKAEAAVSTAMMREGEYAAGVTGATKQLQALAAANVKLEGDAKFSLKFAEFAKVQAAKSASEAGAFRSRVDSAESRAVAAESARDAAETALAASVESQRVMAFAAECREGEYCRMAAAYESAVDAAAAATGRIAAAEASAREQWQIVLETAQASAMDQVRSAAAAFGEVTQWTAAAGALEELLTAEREKAGVAARAAAADLAAVIQDKAASDKALLELRTGWRLDELRLKQAIITVGKQKQAEIDAAAQEAIAEAGRHAAAMDAQKARLDKDWAAAVALKQREADGIRNAAFVEANRLRAEAAADAKKAKATALAAAEVAAKEAEVLRTAIAAGQDQLADAATAAVAASNAHAVEVADAAAVLAACQADVASGLTREATAAEALRQSAAELKDMAADRERIKGLLMEAMKLEDANFRLEKQLAKERDDSRSIRETAARLRMLNADGEAALKARSAELTATRAALDKATEAERRMSDAKAASEYANERLQEDLAFEKEQMAKFQEQLGAAFGAEMAAKLAAEQSEASRRRAEDEVKQAAILAEKWRLLEAKKRLAENAMQRDQLEAEMAMRLREIEALALEQEADARTRIAAELDAREAHVRHAASMADATKSAEYEHQLALLHDERERFEAASALELIALNERKEASERELREEIEARQRAVVDEASRIEAEAAEIEANLKRQLAQQEADLAEAILQKEAQAASFGDIMEAARGEMSSLRSSVEQLTAKVAEITADAAAAASESAERMDEMVKEHTEENQGLMSDMLDAQEKAEAKYKDYEKAVAELKVEVLITARKLIDAESTLHDMETKLAATAAELAAARAMVNADKATISSLESSLSRVQKAVADLATGAFADYVKLPPFTAVFLEAIQTDRTVEIHREGPTSRMLLDVHEALDAVKEIWGWTLAEVGEITGGVRMCAASLRDSEKLIKAQAASIAEGVMKLDLLEKHLAATEEESVDARSSIIAVRQELADASARAERAESEETRLSALTGVSSSVIKQLTAVATKQHDWLCGVPTQLRDADRNRPQVMVTGDTSLEDTVTRWAAELDILAAHAVLSLDAAEGALRDAHTIARENAVAVVARDKVVAWLLHEMGKAKAVYEQMLSLRDVLDGQRLESDHKDIVKLVREVMGFSLEQHRIAANGGPAAPALVTTPRPPLVEEMDPGAEGNVHSESSTAVVTADPPGVPGDGDLSSAIIAESIDRLHVASGGGVVPQTPRTPHVVPAPSPPPSSLAADGGPPAPPGYVSFFLSESVVSREALREGTTAMADAIHSLRGALLVAKRELWATADTVMALEGDIVDLKSQLASSRDEYAAAGAQLRAGVVFQLAALSVVTRDLDAVAAPVLAIDGGAEALREPRALVAHRLEVQDALGAATEALEDGLPVLARNIRRRSSALTVTLGSGTGDGNEVTDYRLYPLQAPMQALGLSHGGEDPVISPRPAEPDAGSLTMMMDLLGSGPAAQAKRASERETRWLAQLSEIERQKEVERIELERASWANSEWDAAREGLLEALTSAWRHRRVSDWDKCAEAAKRLVVAEVGYNAHKLAETVKYYARVQKERDDAFSQAASSMVEAAKAADAAKDLRSQAKDLKAEVKELRRQLTRIDEPSIESLWFVREASARKLIPEEVVLSRDSLLVLIGQIYVEKLAADTADDEAGARRQGMAEFAYDYFLFKFGLRSFAEIHLAALLKALEKECIQSTRVRLFGSFCHVHACPVLPDDALHFFMFCLARMHIANGGLQVSELSYGRTLLPVATALAIARDILAEALPAQTAKAMRDNDELIQGMTIEFNEATVVDMDGLLAHLVGMWTEEYESNLAELKELWAKSDTNGDGMLSFSEFSAMIRGVQPDVPERRIKVMFREAVQLSGSGGDNKILPENFVTVARKYSLGALRVRFPLPQINTTNRVFNELGFIGDSWMVVKPAVLVAMRGMIGDASLADSLRDLTTQTESLENLLERRLDTDSAWALYRRIILGYTMESQRKELLTREQEKQTLGAAAYQTEFSYETVKKGPTLTLALTAPIPEE